MYQRRLPPGSIVTPEFARQLTEISHELGRQVGVLVDRKGHVVHVTVGDAHGIVLPAQERSRLGRDRFNGLRCLHTHLRGEKLTRDDLNDLALLRLDLIAAIDIDKQTGLPGLVYAAHLLPGTANGEERRNSSASSSDRTSSAGYSTGSGSDRVSASTAIDEVEELINEEKAEAKPTVEDFDARTYRFLDPVQPSQLDVDFLELITALEDEMARNRGIRKVTDTRDRAMLVSVTTENVTAARESLDELRELAISGGLVISDEIVQRRQKLDPATLIGKGKLEELIIRSLQLGADMIVFDRELTPAQVRSINAATDLKILDRSQLILDIFAQRAQTSDGRIQVELAQLKYMLPRLSGSGTEMSRLMGGIGGRGPGETKLEVDRRRVRDRITHLEQQLEKIRNSRQQRRAQRVRREMPVVSIVGYTNAGKSTLLNALTQSRVTAEQRMFATLDPTSRRLRLPQDQEIIINDTVGFIRDLPKDLLAAFKATLEEVEQSDLLIHLADASSSQLESQLNSVLRILEELNLSEIPRLLVFNKMDLVDGREMANLCRTWGALPISALDRRSLDVLANEISERLAMKQTEVVEQSSW